MRTSRCRRRPAARRAAVAATPVHWRRRRTRRGRRPAARPRPLRRRPRGARTACAAPPRGPRTRPRRHRRGSGHGATASVAASPSTYFSNSQASRDLPTPASPSRTTSRGRRDSSVPWNSSLTSRRSPLRPVNGASNPSTRAPPPTGATTIPAAHSRTGSDLPFSACSPVSSNVMAGGGQRPRCVVDPHPPRVGCRLDASSGVHRVPGDHPLTRGTDGDRHLTGHDADPHRQTGRTDLRHPWPPPQQPAPARPARPARRRPRARGEPPTPPSPHRR